MYRSKKGFTLIELLVVIAIIAILAAILFPIFAAVRAKARQSQCASNMNQVAKALLAYIGDWNQAFPIPCNAAFEWDRENWRIAVLPYCGGDYNVMRCPQPTKYPFIFRQGTLEPGKEVGHYGLNAFLTHQRHCPLGPAQWFTISYMDEIQDPARTFMVTENKDGDWSGEPYHTYPGDSGDAGHWAAYHGKGSNFVFCDGHIRWMTLEAMEAGNFYYWWKVKPSGYDK